MSTRSRAPRSHRMLRHRLGASQFASEGLPKLCPPTMDASRFCVPSSLASSASARRLDTFSRSATCEGYINVKGYGEFAAQDRPFGWNGWITFSLSPMAPAAAPPIVTNKRTCYVCPLRGDLTSGASAAVRREAQTAMGTTAAHRRVSIAFPSGASASAAQRIG